MRFAVPFVGINGIYKKKNVLNTLMTSRKNIILVNL